MNARCAPPPLPPHHHITTTQHRSTIGIGTWLHFVEFRVTTRCEDDGAALVRPFYFFFGWCSLLTKHCMGARACTFTHSPSLSLFPAHWRQREHTLAGADHEQTPTFRETMDMYDDVDVLDAVVDEQLDADIVSFFSPSYLNAEDGTLQCAHSIQFINSFQFRYTRNNKSGGSKSIRCFPQCSTEGHVNHTFCGNNIVLRAGSKNGAEQKTCVLFAIATAENNHVREILRNAVDPFRPTQHELKTCADAHIGGEMFVSLADQNESDSGSFVVTRKCWHYGWRSSRHSGTVPHCAKAYMFVGQGDEWHYATECSSPNFLIWSTKRKRHQRSRLSYDEHVWPQSGMFELTRASREAFDQGVESFLSPLPRRRREAMTVVQPAFFQEKKGVHDCVRRSYSLGSAGLYQHSSRESNVNVKMNALLEVVITMCDGARAGYVAHNTRGKFERFIESYGFPVNFLCPRLERSILGALYDETWQASEYIIVTKEMRNKVHVLGILKENLEMHLSVILKLNGGYHICVFADNDTESSTSQFCFTPELRSVCNILSKFPPLVS